MAAGGAAAGAASGGLEDRILDALLRCVARWGVAKTTVDDVAREAGCSRATLYRAFPGAKEALLRSLVSREVDRLFSAILAGLSSSEDLAQALAAAVRAAAAGLSGHPALQFVLTYEPELIAPHLGFSRNQAVLTRAAVAVGPGLGRWLPEDEARAAAEWLCRIVVSYVLCPSPEVRLDDARSVRSLVDRFLLPALGRRQVVSTH